MAMSGGKDDGSPMMDINTTPLIDVMLVLLIMFIITIPVATHAVNIDLPPPAPPNQPDPPVNPVRNQITITKDNVVSWNGAAVDDNALKRLLLEAANTKPEPELQFMPDANAKYDLAAKVLTNIKALGVTKFGFVGNDLYSAFGKAANAEASQ